jgi:hypothetical protein
MGSPYVRTIGTVEDMDGVTVAVGVDYDAVTVGAPGRFTLEQAGEFTRLFTSAWREAERQRARMEAERR